MLSAETKIRDNFCKQAIPCRDLGSPFTARHCNLLAEQLDSNGAVGNKELTWQGDPTGRGGALALRLCGALHALGIEGLPVELRQAYPPNRRQNLSGTDRLSRVLDRRQG